MRQSRRYIRIATTPQSLLCALVSGSLVMASPSVFAGGGTAAGATQSLAEKELAKRQALVKEAQALIAEAGLMRDKGNLEEAMRLYHQAYDMLPDAPMAAETKTAARDGYSAVANAQAAKWAQEARYGDARRLLTGILDESFNPENEQAKKQLRELDDPDRFEPALTPQHQDNVKKVTEFLRDGNSLINLGDYDGANRKFQAALVIDRFSQAARRGMERVEQLRSEYLDTARDHNRGRALAQVSELWQDAVPPLDVSGQFGGSSSLVSIQSTRDDLLTKLKTWNVPTVDLQGATLDEVMEFLRIRSRELDPKRKGISFVLRVSPDLASKPITLNLTQVPLIEVLRYVTETTGTAYRLDGYAVTISSQAEKSDTMISQSYRVPPNFIQNAPVGGAPAAGAAPANPFAPAAGAAPQGNTMRRLGAKEFLESQGVLFPEGSAASYNPGTGTLLVRNTVQNLALVDTLVDQASSASPRQVEISVKMVEVSQTRLAELGFDWLLGQFNMPGSPSVFGSGGTLGNQVSATEFASNTVSDLAGTAAPLTAGLRGTGEILSVPSIDGLIKNGITTTAGSKAPGIFALSGVFSDPQFQVVLHGLDNNKGVDLMASPSVVTKSGQRATVVVAREFRYPTEFNPPQIPQTINTTSQSAPITPTTPTAFEKRDVGITLEVEPVIGEDGRTVNINLAPSSVEFEGFIDYGTPIVSGTNTTPNTILQPIFRTNKVNTSVTVWDGNTIVLGGVITEKRHDIKDKVPVLGDIPLVGHAFQSKATSSEKKAVLFFVSVKVIDPAGVRLNQATSTAAR